MRRRLSWLVAIFMTTRCVAACTAQQTAVHQRTDAIRQRVESLPPRTHVSVIPVDGPEVFGDLLSHNTQSFTIYDVDAKHDVTLEYVDVHKVKRGYGGYNRAVGHHVDPTHRMVGLLVAGAALVGVVVAVTLAKN